MSILRVNKLEPMSSEFVEVDELKVKDLIITGSISGISVTGTGGGIPEAPIDEKMYVRKDGQWYQWVDTPSDNKSYIRKNGQWYELVIPEDEGEIIECGFAASVYKQQDDTDGGFASAIYDGSVDCGNVTSTPDGIIESDGASGGVFIKTYGGDNIENPPLLVVDAGTLTSVEHSYDGGRA